MMMMMMMHSDLNDRDFIPLFPSGTYITSHWWCWDHYVAKIACRAVE